MRIASLLLVALVAASACGEKREAALKKQPRQTQEAAPPETGLDLTAIDASVDPGDDFYSYANGRWLKSFEIPDRYAAYSAATMIAERREARLQAIVDKLPANAAPGSIEQKIRDFHASYLDVAAIEAKGLAPLAADFGKIDALSTPRAAAGAFFDPASGGGPIAAYVDVDARDPARHALYVTQGALGLPDRAYYLEDRYSDVRERYRNYIATLFRLAALADADGAAGRILAFETEIARAQWSAEKRSSRELTYNPMTVEQLEAAAPDVPWRSALPAAAAHGAVVREDDAIRNTAAIVAATDIATLHDYLKFRLINAAADVLPAAFDAARAAFLKDASGAAGEVRAARALRAVEKHFGGALGDMYVARHFSPDSQSTVESIVANLRGALEESIADNSWMSDETKARAKEKFAAFAIDFDVATQVSDFRGLDIVAGDAYGNLARLRAFELRSALALLDRPVGASETDSLTIMAAYNPFRNDIVVSAAILEAPIFDADADPAVNYGALGALLGHETTHAFDESGRKTDGTGFLSDWWSDEDDSLYTERMEDLAAQIGDASKIAVAETAADVAGLELAWRAWRRSLGGRAPEPIDGFSGDQRFFFAYAQMLRRAARKDGVAPKGNAERLDAAIRVNTAVRNFDAWYDAFNVTPGDALWLDPDERVQIWR